MSTPTELFERISQHDYRCTICGVSTVERPDLIDSDELDSMAGYGTDVTVTCGGCGAYQNINPVTGAGRIRISAWAAAWGVLGSEADASIAAGVQRLQDAGWQWRYDVVDANVVALVHGTVLRDAAVVVYLDDRDFEADEERVTEPVITRRIDRSDTYAVELNGEPVGTVHDEHGTWTGWTEHDPADAEQHHYTTRIGAARSVVVRMHLKESA